MPAPAQSNVRLRILDAALQLLAEHGVTQPRVSRAAGIRQSHLTYYFPTRPDLLLGVARHSMEILALPLLEQAREGRLRREQLPQILAAALTDRRRMRIMLGVVQFVVTVRKTSHAGSHAARERFCSWKRMPRI